MRFSKNNYNRLVADKMHEWNDESWIFDRNGRMRSVEDIEYFNSEIDTITLSPIFSAEKEVRV